MPKHGLEAPVAQHVDDLVHQADLLGARPGPRSPERAVVGVGATGYGDGGVAEAGRRRPGRGSYW